MKAVIMWWVLMLVLVVGLLIGGMVAHAATKPKVIGKLEIVAPYTWMSKPYYRTVQGVNLLCRTFLAPGYVYNICQVQKTTAA